MNRSLFLIFIVLVCFTMSCIYAGVCFFRNIDDAFSTNDLVINEISSPDSKYKAILFYRGGGATTPDSYHVDIIKKGWDDNREEVYIGTGKISVQWKDNRNLVITSDDTHKTYGINRIYLKKEKINGITIHYKEFD